MRKQHQACQLKRHVLSVLTLSFTKYWNTQVNPLGYELTTLSAVMLNLGMLLGAGIYSVPGSILNSVGSIGLLLFFWLLGSVFAFGKIDCSLRLHSG